MIAVGYLNRRALRGTGVGSLRAPRARNRHDGRKELRGNIR